MNTEEKTRCLDLNSRYKVEIFGLGEVYEMMSVERIRKRLIGKFQSGTLYLSPNKSHIQRGMTLDDLMNQLADSGFQILDKGYADSPPCQSRPRDKDNRRNYSPLIVSVAKIIFFFLVRMEFLRENAKRSHMIYCLVKK
jgi:hypothetical protein